MEQEHIGFENSNDIPAQLSRLMAEIEKDDRTIEEYLIVPKKMYLGEKDLVIVESLREKYANNWSLNTIDNDVYVLMNERKYEEAKELHYAKEKLLDYSENLIGDILNGLIGVYRDMKDSKQGIDDIAQNEDYKRIIAMKNLLPSEYASAFDRMIAKVLPMQFGIDEFLKLPKEELLNIIFNFLTEGNWIETGAESIPIEGSDFDIRRGPFSIDLYVNNAEVYEKLFGKVEQGSVIRTEGIIGGKKFDLPLVLLNTGIDRTKELEIHEWRHTIDNLLCNRDLSSNEMMNFVGNHGEEMLNAAKNGDEQAMGRILDGLYNDALQLAKSEVVAYMTDALLDKKYLNTEAIEDIYTLTESYSYSYVGIIIRDLDDLFARSGLDDVWKEMGGKLLQEANKQYNSAIISYFAYLKKTARFNTFLTIPTELLYFGDFKYNGIVDLDGDKKKK